MAYAVSRMLEKNIASRGYQLSPEEISKLTSFPERSFLMAEEYELLKIALEKNGEKRNKLIAGHWQKFNWLLNGYHGVRVINEEFFSKRLKDLIQSRKIKTRLNYLKNYSAGVKLNFQRLIKKYKLDKQTIRLAQLTQRSSYLQDDRKRKQLETMVYISKLYRELAGRVNTNLEPSLYINFVEFDYFIKNRNPLPELKKRQKSFRLTLNWSKPKFSTAKVIELQKFLDQAYAGKWGKEVKGVVAQPGKVRGTVKIIKNLAGIPDFKNGQILVTQMTSPDYIVAIKKAKAIITDDGGLTCHAAIVARELKKPCIVGTRNATRLLKDGDLVEVDAKKGIVVKI
jgi:phosphohistidine swiveling domain-containing protein